MPCFFMQLKKMQNLESEDLNLNLVTPIIDGVTLGANRFPALCLGFLVCKIRIGLDSL